MTATRAALSKLAAPIAALSRAGWLAIAVGAVTLLFGAAAWLARTHRFDSPYWVPLAWVMALAAAALVLFAAVRGEPAWRPSAIARDLEAGGAWRAGTLSALLEPPAGGGSPSLFGSADHAGAAEIDARGTEGIARLARPARRRAVAGALCAGAGIALLSAAGPVHGTASALWHPGRAWALARAPVRIRASADVVDRGSPVTLSMDVAGRRSATLWLRAPGEAWRPAAITLDSSGHAVRIIGPLQGDLYARLTSGSRSSDTLQVRVRLPVFLGSLSVTAHYPRYLHLDDEPLPVGGDTIVIPAGTRLETRGVATAPLARAGWRAPDGMHELQVAGSGFEGSMVPRASAAYELVIATISGGPLGGDSVRLPVRVMPDSAPHVDIPVPGADTIAPLDLRIPLVVDVRDDHGVTAVAIESRRISALGAAEPAQRETITLPGGRPDRAILSYTMDLGRRGLLPGDTLRYMAVAADNAPVANVGRSREFVVRIPSASEMRDAQRDAGRAISARLDSVAERSGHLERQAEDLAREQPRPQNAAQQRGSENSLQYDQAKKAEAVARSQEQLVKDAEALQRAIEQLKESAKQSGTSDPEWQRHLDEIRHELDRALTPELREKLAELQRSLKDLDAERTQQALRDLSEAQKQLKESLERSRELFKRAALEGDLANLAQEAKDLAREQERWNDQVAKADSSTASAEERRLAARADSLSAGLREAGDRMEDSARSERMDSAGASAQDAASEMHQAQRSANAGQRPQARQQGRKAAQSLQPLAERIDQQKKEMQQEWRQEVSEALDHALAETTRLAERELRVQRQFQRGGDPAAARGDQGAVEEGVQQLIEQLKRASGKNALVSPQIATALGAAQREMEQAREAVASSAPNGREAGERAGGAVDALNAASYELVRARGDVSGAQSGSGMSEAIERMSKLAGQQGQIGSQAAGMLPTMGAGGNPSDLLRLGAQQRALAEQLERMRAQGGTAGAGELAAEAKELARRLEAGRLDPQTVERQERLYRRMLDAGRTLQGHEEDQKKERQSTTAADSALSIPPALRVRLGAEAGRPRMPTWEQLQRLTPEERRLVVDYFRKLSDGSRP